MNRGRFIGGAAVVLIGLAVGGAFMIGQTLGSADEASTSASAGVAEASATNFQPASEATGREVTTEKKSSRRRPLRVIENVMDVGNGPVSVKVTTMPAPELPDAPSDVHGVFVSREDNSITVGTGAIELNLDIRQTPGGAIEPNVSLTADGPEIEVVVTHDTVIYREETEEPGGSGGDVKGGEYAVQQVVRQVDSLEELGKNTEVIAWGEQRGDRVVADILVYRIVNPSF